jgi:hypothetical protein
VLQPHWHRLRPPGPARGGCLRLRAFGGVGGRRAEVDGEAGSVGGDVADDSGADGVGQHAAGKGAEAAVLALVHRLAGTLARVRKEPPYRRNPTQPRISARVASCFKRRGNSCEAEEE